MRDRNQFHTTTSAEFRELVESARATGRLAELIEAIQERLDRHRVALQAHQAARDFQQIQETKRVIANLESRLQIARQVLGPEDDGG